MELHGSPHLPSIILTRELCYDRVCVRAASYLGITNVVWAEDKTSAQVTAKAGTRLHDLNPGIATPPFLWRSAAHSLAPFHCHFLHSHSSSHPRSPTPPALEALGLAFENLGSCAAQSIAGATATGTHGTGRLLGSMATQVRLLL